MRSLVICGLALFLGAAVVLVASRVVADGPQAVPPASAGPTSSPLVPTVGPSEVNAPAGSTVASEPPLSYPEQGSRAYDVVAGTSAVFGTSGQLMRFQVAVERDIHNLDAAAFATFVENTYADPRGWASGGAWRMQRVGPGQPYDFQVVLVTPGTREVLCADGGHDRYTNCRNGTHVVINADRWAGGIPNYGAPLVAYREYAINHETGHRLGDGHELCPGPGQPAPLMQQQTLGLHGCVANAWPYLDGKRYRGQSGAYNDPVPPRTAPGS